MSEQAGKKHHSLNTMRLLKDAALPSHAENFGLPTEMSRRGLLKLLMGASAALAVGVPGCARKPVRKIVSRARGPEYQKPGKPLYYSSTWTDGPYPYGLLIKTVDGRPIKIEGNPDHPINQGTSTAAMQASILSLYDPDRLRTPTRSGQTISWQDVDKQVIDALSKAASVVLLTRATLGPAERALIDDFLARCPAARHFVHEPAHDGPRRTAWQQIYTKDGELLPRIDRAKIILSLECDFLGTDGAVLENVRSFVAGRRLDDAAHQHAEMNRLHVAEGVLTLTGSNADQRLRLRPSALGALALAIRAALGGDDAALSSFAQEHHVERPVLDAIVRDLAENHGAALVVAGAHLPSSVHAAVALLNDDLGAAGQTLEWNPMPAALPVSDPADVRAAFATGVDVAICVGVNPVYDWPDGDFSALLAKANLSIGHGLYADETLSVCNLALPSNHYLESWNDAEPRAGVKTLCQPVIAPLFDTRQEAESLLIWTRGLAGDDAASGETEDWHGYLQNRWQRRLVSEDTPDATTRRARAWEDSLRIGGEFAATVTPLPALNRDVAKTLAQSASPAGEYELVVLPHHAVHDGRFAGNGWLQELPDPVSKLVWDNAAAISPKTAERLNLAEGDLLGITVGSRSAILPALLQPGMADGVVETTLGHGRSAGGSVAQEAGGTNVAPLMAGPEGHAARRLVPDVKLHRDSLAKSLVRTQKQVSMHGRPIVLDGNLDEYRHAADFVKHRRHLPESADLYQPYDYSKGHKWAMAIDLNACTGCGACMTACQAENNIPIVGREQCDKGREMHWIRIDRYHAGDPDNPTVHHQPMLCQHCDNAPCENVCPVNATTHSPDGLNEMVYNRCVGTRYCANNCPYKVRRFNFLRFQEKRLRDPVQELVFNPQVTVRGVGVMEKCTFCVQRINAGRYTLADAQARVPDGTIQTACQQSCPAQAIVFGDLNDPDSKITRLRASGRAFHVLEELNVKPNVSYLARVRNPHPGAAPKTDTHAGSHEG